MIFYLNPRRRSDTAASPALTCVGSPGSPPEVAASDLIPGYKPPFLERTLVCIEPQNLEDDDLMMFADRELDMMMMFISICAGD